MNNISLILLASKIKKRCEYKDNSLFYGAFNIKIIDNMYYIYLYDTFMLATSCINVCLKYLNYKGVK